MTYCMFPLVYPFSIITILYPFNSPKAPEKLSSIFSSTFYFTPRNTIKFFILFSSHTQQNLMVIHLCSPHLNFFFPLPLHCSSSEQTRVQVILHAAPLNNQVMNFIIHKRPDHTRKFPPHVICLQQSTPSVPDSSDSNPNYLSSETYFICLSSSLNSTNLIITSKYVVSSHNLFRSTSYQQNISI